MYSKLTSVLRALLYFSVIFWVLSSGNPLANPATKGGSLGKSVPPQTAQTSENKTDSPQVEAEKNDTHTPKEKAVDKAGERIGQLIDKFSRCSIFKTWEMDRGRNFLRNYLAKTALLPIVDLSGDPFGADA